MSEPVVQQDPSRSSYYLGSDFYRDLVDAFTGWQTDAAEIVDPALRDSCRRLIDREARLLEQDRHEDWLALYAAECVYWVPASPDGGDPRREVAIAFDDRRRLEDRVFRLQSPYAWSQRPASRTSRLVSNVALYETADTDVVMARSTFHITEFQDGDIRRYAGWCGHRLRRIEAEDNGRNWEILAKQVNLIYCDRNLRNPSITL